MRRLLQMSCLLALMIVILASCGPKPQYKTAQGKRKLKYYNDIQYERKRPDFSRWN